MTFFKRIFPTLFGAFLAASAAPQARAVVIAFDGGAFSGLVYAEGGFELANTESLATVEVLDFSGGPNPDLEITPALLFGSGQGLVLTQTGGGAFDLHGFGLEKLTGQALAAPVPFTITGTKSDATIVSDTVSFTGDALFSGPVFSTGGDSFTDLTTVEFSTASAGLAIFFPIALDNITVTQPVIAAPEPGSLALLGVGVLGLALMRRRRARAG